MIYIETAQQLYCYINKDLFYNFKIVGEMYGIFD